MSCGRLFRKRSTASDDYRTANSDNCSQIDCGASASTSQFIFAVTLVANGRPVVQKRQCTAFARPRRDSLFINNLVALPQSVSEQSAEHTFNAGSAVFWSVGEVARATSSDSDARRPIVSRNEKRPNEIMDVRLDSTKARRELGWARSVKPEDGISRVVNFAGSGLRE